MTASMQRAVLAGGCFWGVQDLLRRYPGVISTRVGYTGGEVPNATYRNHGNHAEAIEIIFDPEIISYRKLLEFFFQIHDPSTLNRQGNDRGASYRSAIFYTSDEQKRIAEDTIADVDASGLWPGKVVTEVARAGRRLHGGHLWASHWTRGRLPDDARSRGAQPDDGRGLRASGRDADGDDHGTEGDPQQPPGAFPDRRYRRNHAATHQDGDPDRLGAEHSHFGSRCLPGGAAGAAGSGPSRIARGYRGRRCRSRH